jgi:glycosyltransferase involved in cell wall biosynthesis
VRALVLTTSYPRFEGDVAGTFVADGVAALRTAGIDVTVVSPANFRHFGIAYGHGIVQNLRARPWLVALVPGFLISFALAARRAARDADVVHAHWLPSALAALATRRPFVLQVWGTDVELARRAPWLARPLLRRARVTIAASAFLAGAATALGARDVRVIASPVPVPDSVVEPEEPPHVLFVGRLSEEKGILEFLEATEGIRRVIVGDGPLRPQVPEALGFVSRDKLGAYYERAAVVCVPSRREGYGMVAREAMAHRRPVVGTRVGGLSDAIAEGRTGLLVEARSSEALRSAVERLLGDPGLRSRLGAAAREDARTRFSAESTARALIGVYAQLVAPPMPRITRR